jgi:transcriptional regulator with XRE-family HTH domain
MSTPKVIVSRKSYDSLLEVRRRLGLKQRELADIIGVDPNYISMIESGKKPFSKKLVKKLELLESSNKAHQENMSEKKVHYSTGICPECAKKEEETALLKKVIDKLVSK